MDKTTHRELMRELGRWRGVIGHRIEQGGKHTRLVVETAKGRRFVTMSLTASDHRAIKNKVRDLRHALRDLGAEKE